MLNKRKLNNIIVNQKKKILFISNKENLFEENKTKGEMYYYQLKRRNGKTYIICKYTPI